MKVVEVRSLLNEKIREVEIDNSLTDIFKSWYEKFISRTNREPTLIDVFYSGYVIANPSVREMFKVKRKKEEEPRYYENYI